jgi:hypothetical protein
MSAQMAFPMGDSIQERFEEFHAANPVVLETLERETQRWLDAGHSRLGIGMLWERLRWVLHVEVTGNPVPRLNDHHRSRYVRLMIQRHPEWSSVFELRELRSA